jgi:hypothetical protein
MYAAPKAGIDISWSRLQSDIGKRLRLQSPGTVQPSCQEMRIGIELAGDNGGETFIGFSSVACDGVMVRSPPLHLAGPELHLCSRERILPIMLSETFNDLDPWHAFIGEEFDDMALFKLHDSDTFCPMNPLLLAKFAR